MAEGEEQSVQSAQTVGLYIPPRESDCSGVRPSWYPFQINVCDEDCDEPDPLDFTARHLAIPEP